MSAVTTIPWGRELTVDDLDAMPDDGHRYELIEGTLIVSPAPSWPHQRALRRLAMLLDPLVPEGVELLWAPFDVRTSTTTNLQPDLLLARLADLTHDNLPVGPLLAVEVLSPSTQLVDRNLKKAVFEGLGTASFWIVDPLLPAVTAWELVDGAYIEAGHAEGDEALELERPFPLRIVPRELVS